MIKLRVMGNRDEVNDFVSETKRKLCVTGCSEAYPNRNGSDIRVYLEIEPISLEIRTTLKSEVTE